MSARLWLAWCWTPRTLMVREVRRIEESTNAALDALLVRYAPEAVAQGADDREGGDLEGRRAAMARGHERRVQALVAALGTEEAVRQGREALFRTGLRLGEEARARLGVGDDRKDLLRAARVLYRILGIEFEVVSASQGERMEVRRCALSAHYSKEACLILSAVDEGVVKGLSPQAELVFEKRITDGSMKCVAHIKFRRGEA